MFPNALNLIRETLLSYPHRKVGSASLAKRRAANQRARIARRITRGALVSRILAVLALAALTGCATVTDFTARHPRASAVIAASIVTSVALSTRGHRERQFPMSEPLIATPSVDCSKVSCQ